MRCIGEERARRRDGRRRRGIRRWSSNRRGDLPRRCRRRRSSRHSIDPRRPRCTGRKKGEAHHCAGLRLRHRLPCVDRCSESSDVVTQTASSTFRIEPACKDSSMQGDQCTSGTTNREESVNESSRDQRFSVRIAFLIGKVSVMQSSAARSSVPYSCDRRADAVDACSSNTSAAQALIAAASYGYGTRPLKVMSVS